jgi:hypothetical protein
MINFDNDTPVLRNEKRINLGFAEFEKDASRHLSFRELQPIEEMTSDFSPNIGGRELNQDLQLMHPQSSRLFREGEDDDKLRINFN